MPSWAPIIKMDILTDAKTIFCDENHVFIENLWWFCKWVSQRKPTRAYGSHPGSLFEMLEMRCFFLAQHTSYWFLLWNRPTEKKCCITHFKLDKFMESIFGKKGNHCVSGGTEYFSKSLLEKGSIHDFNISKCFFYKWNSL